MINEEKKKIETIKEELITTDSNNIDDSMFDKNSLKTKIVGKKNVREVVGQVNSKLNT